MGVGGRPLPQWVICTYMEVCGNLVYVAMRLEDSSWAVLKARGFGGGWRGEAGGGWRRGLGAGKRLCRRGSWEGVGSGEGGLKGVVRGYGNGV